jgi:colicin import membrane protein
VKGSKKQLVQDTKNKATVEKASSLQIDKTLANISGVGLQIQSTLAQVSEQLVTKHSELKAVDDAIALKKQELEALHGADKVLMSIDELNTQHAHTLETLYKEREEIKAANALLNQELATARSREEKEYQYKTQQARKNEQDKFDEEVRVRNRDEKIRQEIFEKSFSERDAVLNAKEKQYNDALTRLATFEVEVKKESDKAAAIAVNSVKKEYDHQIAMIQVTHKSEVDKLKFDNQRLVESGNNLEKTIETLQTHLATAQAAQTQLAKDAVAAAANQKATADMQALLTNIGGSNGTRPRS